ncbi:MULTISPECIES: AMIN-like domain-containing (lipo)protein [Streptomyces]|jgi:hypothetical protein|uniref:AMIN-like domain-containing protein n=1 Tax=Streptomyces doudnae TaxID=3075536 RepID=A0ABD5ELB5_9ACTN|nr:MULTISPECIES: hypothetical protein [unclassified Streptomyces]MDT0435102.1 hypothetical protein [Streptomyces sp. DSM 41981]SCE44239.1 hypothetical protein GA0115242_13795 [Streptomyces sp. SolWspMP-5a-2]
MRRLGTALISIILAGGGLLALPAPAGAADCGVTWGSLDKSGASAVPARLTGVRAGRHACWDRLVLDVAGTDPIGYSARYVDVLRQDPSGAVVPIAGGAVLEISLHAPRHDSAGQPYPPLPAADVTGFTTFREFTFAGGSEGYTQTGLGVRARLPFRVLQSADHLVVDVAHTW